MGKFKNKLTEEIADGKAAVKGINTTILRRAMIKITMVMAAADLKDLTVPPSNRLEKLQDDRKGQYSIRVNDQYRICFEWKNNEATEIEFTDYN